MTAPDAEVDPVKALADLIADIPVAMLTTLSEDGRLVSRPMTAPKTRFTGNLVFFAARSSALVRDIGLHAQVNVAFVDGDRQRQVSVCGAASILDHPAERRRHWHPEYEAWFPKGVDDPELVLISVAVEHADTWESPSRLVASLIGFAQTILGQERKPVAGTHAEMDL